MATPDIQEIPFISYTPRVAIVTGGAQGIGYAIGHRLSDDGFDIAVNDIPTKQQQLDAVVEEVRKKGRRAIAVPGDVSSEVDVKSMIEKTVQELGGVDVMVANAGIGVIKPFLETSIDEFETVHAINTRGVFLCFKYAAAQIVKQGRGGRLIAASSVAGKSGGQLLTAYAASKFAVRAIVQCASAELRNKGITANAYAPGSIFTPMFVDAQQKGNNPGLNEKAIGKPENIASIVSYLAKPESHFVNGQSITVDGGHFRFD